jgi:hypothetical protein
MLVACWLSLTHAMHGAWQGALDGVRGPFRHQMAAQTHLLAIKNVRRGTNSQQPEK